MDQEGFYKGQYDKSLVERTEINNSLSTPIGILTALLAGLYFCLTNFNYSNGFWLTRTFICLSVVSSVLLVIAIFYLVLAFSDFRKGRDYISLNDSGELDIYYKNLVAFYTNQPASSLLTIERDAKKDFDEYLLAELIRNASNNQRINRIKTALLFQSHKFMIFGLISLSLLIIPFGIDFGLNRGKDKVQKIRIDQGFPLNLTIKYQKDTTLRLYIKP
jgi:hypothetical protein